MSILMERFTRRPPDSFIPRQFWKESMKNKPLKGFVQIIQVIVFFVGGIIIISILIGKSPATLFAGLGASAAILMLVFKDTILGFVAGIQLSANDMLRPGDWITMSKYGADGTVIEVTLNAIKVRNFDMFLKIGQ